MSALQLLAGDAQSFREKVWASHVHVHQADPDLLESRLSMADVDHLLTSVGLRAPALRLVKDGSVLPTSEFTRGATLAGSPVTGLVDARKALALYDEGATVVLQGLHRYWPPLTELVRTLELELGHPCQANAYLTPPGAQGFAKHVDTHDVFVFQTSGHKLWEVDDSELLMSGGMSVYLPAGTPHAARSQEVPSLHVTVGINQLTWRSLLTDVTTRLLSDPEYDVPLPAGYLDEPEALAAALTEILATYTADLHGLSPDEVSAQQVTAFLTRRPSVLAGGLLGRVTLADLGPDTVLERRSTTPCALVSEPDGVRLLLGDRELRMPLRLLPALQLVRDEPHVAVHQLPGLDAAGRLVLARRLVREGLLRVVR